MTTFGKAKKSGAPRKAPKVPLPSKKNPNVMKESDDKRGMSSPQAPLTRKKLSK